MTMRIAIDRDVLSRFLHADPSDVEAQVVGQLATMGSALCVTPLLAEEIEIEGAAHERRWRENSLEEIKADDFLIGCAVGIARRYLDYYPDPRDCRLVAEAECAKLDTLITLREELIRGLGNRVETIRIETPQNALRRALGQDRD
jgi:hypothetical protein